MKSPFNDIVITEIEHSTRIRYSDAEWLLLAKAIVAERDVSPDNYFLTFIQLANQAQVNQRQILVGDGPGEWPKRNFTATNQLEKVSKMVQQLHQGSWSAFKTLETKLEEERSLSSRLVEHERTAKSETAVALVEIVALRGRITELENKKPSFTDFDPADIEAEAAFIAATRAAQMTKLTMQLFEGLSGLNNNIELSKMETNEKIDNVASKLEETLTEILKKIPQEILQVPAGNAIMKTQQTGRKLRQHHKK